MSVSNSNITNNFSCRDSPGPAAIANSRKEITPTSISLVRRSEQLLLVKHRTLTIIMSCIGGDRFTDTVCTICHGIYHPW